MDTVLHLAANVVQPYTDLRLHEFDQINNWGTSNLADAIEDSDVKKVIYMSSMTVYGSKEEIIDEHSETHPMTYYGISKLKGEGHIRRIRDRQLYILRLANVYGCSPNMRIDSVFNRLMFEAHFKGKVNKVGDGSQSRAFISMHTFCEQLSAVLLGNIPAGTYNMAEINLSINAIIDLYKDLFPDMEVITLDQSAPLKTINVRLPTKLSSQLGSEEVQVLDQLKQFKEHFSF